MIVLAMALGLIGTACAQADEWTIEQDTLGGLGIAKETTSSTGGAFELSVPKLSLTIKCTSESGTGVVTEEAKDSDSMTLSGCGVAGAEKTCAVKSPGKSAGVLSAALTTQFLEEEVAKTEKYYDKAALTMIVELTGEECPYPEKTEVKGTTAREVPAPGEESKERTEKFSKAITEESKVAGLTFGASPAVLTGQNTERASGAYSGAPITVSAITVQPVPIEFTEGPGTTKQVKIFNTAIHVTIKLLEIGFTGPYGLFDPNHCINAQLPPVSMMNFCTVELKCNEAKMGTFFLKWNTTTAPANGRVTVLTRC
ncbi:MAG TPA: hypothetical protein VH042_02475 [Solirubrobacterales bacterium]|nr:hypothetical protein [Solirubrobacterales bacterium]